MKNFLLFLFVVTLVGCVDKDFDLSKVDDSDIVIGNEFIAPIGTINIKYSEIAGLPDGKSTMIDLLLPEAFSMSYPLSSGFDQGILDQISGSGSQSIIINLKHQLPEVTFSLKVSFDVAGVLYDGTAEKQIKIDISKEKLQQIAESKNITVEFTASGNRQVSVDLNDSIAVDLVLYRKGGIKL